MRHLMTWEANFLMIDSILIITTGGIVPTCNISNDVLIDTCLEQIH